MRRIIDAETKASWGEQAGAEFDTNYAALFGTAEKKIGLQSQDGTATVRDYSVSFEESAINEFVAKFW